MSDGPLAALRVADLSSGIAGAYCTKLLADAGAEVFKLEDGCGDPLRAWSATGGRPDGSDGALFGYLAAGKRSVVVDPKSADGRRRADEILVASDAVVWSDGSALTRHPVFQPAALHDRFDALTVVAVSQFGLDGPWAGRAATEFTLQAWAGAIGWRGQRGSPPVSVGGRVGEWVTGAFAANGLLASLRRTGRTGQGELVDVAMLDAIALTMTNMHPVSYFSEAGTPRDPHPTSLLPGIHPARDGWVGFMTGTGQQWLDFCVLVERYDWLEDESLIRAAVREQRRAEIVEHIDAWTRARTCSEIIESAAALRVPVAPVGTGESIPAIDHFVDQHMLHRSADGTFVQPARPYRLGATPPPAAKPSPALGANTQDDVEASRRRPSEPSGGAPGALPFADLRIVELAAFWAGPSAAHWFAALGAEVIKVESPTRPDGMRTISTRNIDEDDWWEHAPLYHAVNTGKLDLGLRLDAPAGRELLRRLIERSDVLIENFSPRVIESWGLDWPAIHAINPRLILVRMPAFGLAGPWRDRTGFAQTMEQASGMAWITGHPDGSPTVPSGVCDPLAGAHAAFALQVALAERARTGLGLLVEVPMVHSALNVAAEQVVEFSAYGRLLVREGNRGPAAAPQNLYPARPDPIASDPAPPYVALAVETDRQWQTLVEALGRPAWALDPELATVAGRRAAEATVDGNLAEWFARHTADEAVATLWDRGVPVARVTMPHRPAREQLDHRGFFEDVAQPPVGRFEAAGLPVRFGAGPKRVHRTPAPGLGEHNRDVLTRVLGLTPDEISALEDDGVVGGGLARVDR